MTATETGPLTAAELDLIDAWWRAANYLSVGQIYLLDNPLLTEPLSPERLAALTDLAPLHQPKSLAALDAVTGVLPDTPGRGLLRHRVPRRSAPAPPPASAFSASPSTSRGTRPARPVATRTGRSPPPGRTCARSSSRPARTSR